MIYYIGCRETYRVKIGFTDVSGYKRLDKLQTGSPTPLVLLGIIEGTKAVERALHRRFAKDRLHGEWFRVSEQFAQHLQYVAFQHRDVLYGPGKFLEKFARRALAAAAAAEPPKITDFTHYGGTPHGPRYAN